MHMKVELQDVRASPELRGVRWFAALHSCPSALIPQVAKEALSIFGHSVQTGEGGSPSTLQYC